MTPIRMNLQFARAPEHDPFYWKAGKGAALLIHGFPGSPAEMRPLGKVITHCGWSASGLLLPGFGADIATLEQRSYTDWADAVSTALRDLAGNHAPLVVAGFSLGGSLALNAALEHRLDGIMLLAPFWNIGNKWISRAWPLLALFRRRLKPLERADFTSPEVRSALLRMFGAIDVDDSAVQEQIRELSVSSRCIGEILNLGRRVARNAQRLKTPALVIQGAQDPIASPARTKELIRGFAGNTCYYEVEAGHGLVDPGGAAWTTITQHVVGFLDNLNGQNLREHW